MKKIWSKTSLFKILICIATFFQISLMAEGKDNIIEKWKAFSFTEDEVLVVLDTNYTLDKCLKSFDKIEHKNISVLTEKFNRTKTDFKEILCVKLAKSGKKNVFDAIRTLQNEEGINSIEPNIYDTFEIFYDNEALYDPLRQINGLNAWNITKGVSQVNVGIIDTGIDGNNQYISSNIERNISKSFISSSDSPFIDCVGHGTHVAGIVCGSYNGVTRIDGIAPGVSVVSLKISNDENFLTNRLINAISYAESNNIKVLNYSGGGTNTTNAKAQAIQNYSGIFVCAAGNESNDIDINPYYPACYNFNNLITVGATNSREDKADFSNYGASVDIYAPGVCIYSAFPENLSSAQAIYLSGTSMATPFVSGVAGLLFSVIPSLNPLDIKNIIINSANDILIHTDRSNNTSLVKRLNVGRALTFGISNYGNLDSANLMYNTFSNNYTQSTQTMPENLVGLVLLNVSNPYNYTFEIQTTTSTKIFLYDDGLNTIYTCNFNNNSTFDFYLNSNVYILKVEPINIQSQNVFNLKIIGETHNHQYSEWAYNGPNGHIEKCSCGALGNNIASHVILSGMDRNRYAFCLGCHARLDLRVDRYIVQM